MKKSTLIILSLLLCLVGLSFAQEMTDVGTPRSETLIFQTFDRQTANPDQFNPLLSSYAVWRGFRELGWGTLWETDTGTGETVPELADGLPEVLNDEHTEFRFKLKQGVYWSDGVEFTADDIIYTLDTYFSGTDCLNWFGIAVITGYVESYSKVDDYTIEVKTQKPAFDFTATMGTPNWGPRLNIVPKHVFEQQENLCEFRNPNPATLGPYTIKEFDPNGFWQLWELRDDWQRSSWANLDSDGYMPKYVLYKDFGPEETRSLSFVQNQYDVDTFMSPDSIKAAQARNNNITTFSPDMPYHNMDDACSYGILMNMQRAPLDRVEVRWALALALDLKMVGVNSLSGEFLSSPLPLADTQIKHPVYVEPLLGWLNDFTLADGYKPFDANFTQDLANVLKQTGAKNIPEDPSAFGIGWWKYDPEQAGKLLESVGFTKNNDGKWLLPSGELWTLEFVIPGDWNKVMQRVGFSIADSWRNAGIEVNARQVDNAEFTVVQNTNAQRTTELNWTNCFFTNNYLSGAWSTIKTEYINPVDSNETNAGNQYQWSNEKVDELVTRAAGIDVTSEEFYEIGREVLKEFVNDMAYINLMGIPTTIPTNEYYFTGFPKADNYYAVPYSWWSSAKAIVANIKPTGN
ncbi:MAG: ABC transporter substrate-binding protein [Trueperaceae bacterium]|nr:ABC transporter substrate-binding protein [Trueperaceae bacterium]